nr:PREDICTED: uncharacterized protein LOC107079827 isoform X1 [Lepisosteus oculatus]
MLRESRKKVTFLDKPSFLGNSADSTTRQPHSRDPQSVLPEIVRQQSQVNLSYRRLRDRGVLTTEQIRKIKELLEIIQNADIPVFDSFCAVLGEMGCWQLVQTLQAAVRAKLHATVTSVKKSKTSKNVVLCHEQNYKGAKEENKRLCRKMQYLRQEYEKRLCNLEGMLVEAREERKQAERERCDSQQKSAELRRLNTELQALIARLQSSFEEPAVITDVGKIDMDCLPRSKVYTHGNRGLGLFLG